MTTKNNAKKNIKFKVNLLDVASHINKLIPGLEIEGKTNGNIAIVAVKITPAIVNAENNSELCKFQLKDDYSTDTAVVFAELVKDGSTWAFHTIGEGKQADLNGIAALFS